MNENIFTEIYKQHLWGGKSRSGTGSDLEQTEVIRRAIPDVFDMLGVRSVLDIPCGDLHWWQHLRFRDEPIYIGADIVDELIHDNRMRYPGRNFVHLDIRKDDLPLVDVIFARDILGHLPDADVQRAVKNIRRANPKFLISTTFPEWHKTDDILLGQWRPINLQRFGLTPMFTIDEQLMNAYGNNVGKHLGVYAISSEHSVAGQA